MRAWVYVVLGLGAIAVLVCVWLLCRELGYWLGLQLGQALADLTGIIYSDPLSGF